MHHSQQETVDGNSKQFIAPDLQSVEIPRGLADHTTEVLRLRLGSLAFFLLCALGLALLLSINLGSAHFWIHRIGAPLAFMIVLATWRVLRVRKKWSSIGLHRCEFALFAAAVLAGLAVPLCLVPHAANQLRSLAVIHTNFAAWSVLILTYGIFIPNTAKRAAMILIPMACLPLFVNLWLRTHSVSVAEALRYPESWLTAPLPFVSAFASVMASHAVTKLRRDVFAARQLGQYFLKKKIASGGMGDIYEAEHTLLKRRCALKMIRADRLASSRAASQFEREVKAAAELTHWNTIDIFDYGFTEDGRFYYVMALLQGTNLEELVQQFGAIEPGRAIHFLSQACDALEEAHRRGLIHRDLKPANLFVGQRGGVWDHLTILDFGLVKGDIPSADEDADTDHVVGTPLYMAPEQITAGEMVDARADIYALGAVGYFLASGKSPFASTNLMQTIMAHMHEKVRPLPELIPEVPRDFADIIQRCLQKEASERFQDVGELRAALANCESTVDWNPALAQEWWRQAGWD